MKNQNNLYKIKKIKLLRLISKNADLKKRAIMDQEFKMAAYFRDKEKLYEGELLILKIGI
jgi:hypothetical protein